MMMKKIIATFCSAIMLMGFYSCSCDCVGPSNGDPNDKVCKDMYEAVNGPNTWSSYESQALSVGWTCK